MPNVDDHGLEVLKKAALDIGVKPKTDYALQVHLVNPEDISGGGGAGSLTTQTVSFSITVPQIGQWVLVPTVSLVNVFSVEVFDATNTVQIFVDYRISLSNVLEIRSNNAQTYTIRIIGT